MKRHKADMGNLEALVDVAKTYRWPALFLSTAMGLAVITHDAIKGLRR